MDVKCIDNRPFDQEKKKHPDLTVGKIYYVLGIEGDYYRIPGDLGKPYLYKKTRFEMVDDQWEPGWVSKTVSGVEKVYPPELFGDFFEIYFNGDMPVYRKLIDYAHRLKCRRIDKIYDKELVDRILG